MAVGHSALDAAIALFRCPALAGAMRSAPLPTDVEVVIRIAGGCTATLVAAQDATGLGEGILVDASAFYTEQILLHAEADSYRVLGGSSDTALKVLREHRNWLLKRFHPDLGTSAWETVLTRRVLSAWGEVKSGTVTRRTVPGVRLCRQGRSGGASSNSAAFSPPWIAQPLASPTPIQSDGWRRLLFLAAVGVVAMAYASYPSPAGRSVLPDALALNPLLMPSSPPP